MSAHLEDMVVVITGASSGIGAKTAETLVSAGARVVLGARRTERLDALVGRLGKDHALAVRVDVSVPEDSRRLVARGMERFGAINAFVANAGIGLYGGILDHTDDEYAEMIDVNFAGTVWGVRAAVPAFLSGGGGGDVVIIASVAGLRGGANEAVYAGSKFAQVGLAGALDRELRSKGIRVSAICPAGVYTDFAIGKGRNSDDPGLADLLRPDDVAQAVLAVLSQPRRVRTTLWSIWSMADQS